MVRVIGIILNNHNLIFDSLIKNISMEVVRFTLIKTFQWRWQDSYIETFQMKIVRFITDHIFKQKIRFNLDSYFNNKIRVRNEVNFQ